MADIIESKNYSSAVISLWQEAFGDCVEDIQFFLDNCQNKSVLTLSDNNELCAMLFLVDAKSKDKSYKYIYAASTFKKHRGKGYMSALLVYAAEKYADVLLIPANDDLVKYYRKRNFNKIIDINDIKFNECSEIQEYLFEGCALAEPYALAFVKGE